MNAVQPMAIPCIRVDGQNENETGFVENCDWPMYGPNTTSRLQDVFSSSPFKLQTDLPIIDHYRTGASFSTLDKFVHESHDDPMRYGVQSAPLRESPFEGVPWIPEPATAVTPYHDRLSSPDETIHSSASGAGSGYWQNQWPARFDAVSCSPASHDMNMSRRGSAFDSLSATSDVHDAFTWSQDPAYRVQEQAFPDVANMGQASFPQNIPSAHISRHPTPFNAQTMFHSTEVDFDARSAAPTPQHMVHNNHNAFRYPSPFDAHHFRASLTPCGTDMESDFDIPFKSDDCDSDYMPGRVPRSRVHRQSRSATHIRRPSYNQHHRSSSYNAATSAPANRITKRPPRRPSSTSHVPSYSPKSSNRHNPAHHHAHSSTSTIPPSAQQAPRPFTCPLTPYSCPKTFTSKNEWKRHVLTQHLLLGFWRCDLCPDAAARPNDFNRKDLFVQHLRRMHCGDRRGSASVFDEGSCLGETTEQALERVRRRCWIQLRKPPRRLACCFCAKAFESKEGSTKDADQERERGCAVDWLEHVGRHLVALTSSTTSGSPTVHTPVKVEEPVDDNNNNNAKGHRRKRSGGSNASKSSADAALSEQKKPSHTDLQSFSEPPWADDELLLSWLIEEGLVEESNGKGPNKWTLVDRGIASEAAMTRRHGGEEDADIGGDGEE